MGVARPGGRGAVPSFAPAWWWPLRVAAWPVFSSLPPRGAPVVAAAIVAGGNELEHAEYLLFDATVLDNVGLTAAPVMGQTPVADVNRLHAEVPISARSAAALAGAMYGRAVPTLELKPNVKKHLLAALREGRLDVSRITSGKVKKELGIGA